MSAPLRPLLPRPGPDGTLTPSLPPRLDSKRRNTTNACDPCRKRKAKCDGKRPKCLSCLQRQVACTYSIRRRIVLTTEEEEAQRREQRKTREATEVVRLLRTLPPDLALDLLESLRSNQDLSFPAGQDDLPEEDFFPAPDLSPQLSRSRLLRSLLPPTQNSLEFELVIRHPIAYPTLFPLRAASLPLHDLLRPTRVERTRGSLSASPPPNSQSPVAPDWATTPEMQMGTSPAAENDTGRTNPARDSTPSSPPIRPLVDDRLKTLRIQEWTNVSISNELAARVISLYLEIDYPVLPLFNADLFLRDLVSLRQHFCSNLLVSALLAWACQAYTPISSETAALSVEFFREAQATLAGQTRLNALTTATAIQLLSQTATTYGNEPLAEQLLRKGIEVGKSMGLFGVHSQGESAEQWLDNHDEWRRAASYTAWGVFNWVTLHSLHYHTAEIDAPPMIPMPPDSPVAESDPHAAIKTKTRSFNASCRLWSIFSDVVWKYYGNDRGNLPLQASLDFAEETYHRLLAWADGLPLNLTRGDQNTHAAMMMHIYFHAIVADLFRPLLREPWRFLHLASFTNAHASPEAVYAASANQLKRLLLIYRLAFRTATLSVFWQTALVYVANAVVREADTGSVEWRFYLELCLAGLEELYISFRVFGAVAKGLLVMALQHGAVEPDDAWRVARELQELGRHHGDAEEPTAPTWIIDLDLAMTDPEAAQGCSLATRFQELILADQLSLPAGSELGSCTDDSEDES